MRQRLQRVVQVHARQRAAQLAVLLAHPLTVDDQQWRTKLADQPLYLCGLERIDAAFHQGSMPAAMSSFPLSLLTTDARCRRSRTASHFSSAGTS